MGTDDCVETPWRLDGTETVVLDSAAEDCRARCAPDRDYPPLDPPRADHSAWYAVRARTLSGTLTGVIGISSARRHIRSWMALGGSAGDHTVGLPIPAGPML